MGMSSKEFWELTWWEWNLKLYWLHKQKQKRNADHEVYLEGIRQFMTLFAAANRGKNQPRPKPQDFFRLSYDEEENEVEEPKEAGSSFKEAKAQLGSRIKDGNK